jgi:ATPase subunit of ABC transporter with duplicated ATPase domains
LAQKAVPGIPRDMRIRLVQQHLVGTDESTLSVLIKSDTDRTALLNEQLTIESRLESDEVSDDEVLQLVARLETISAELDVMKADTIEERALNILVGLQFDDQMIHGPTKNLSGGWRMRLSLAQSLLTTSDLILYDEVTNHLDLLGLDWLIANLLADSGRTLIVVSHDTMFLDAICTDIVVLEHQRLTYHPGNYSDYLRQVQEKAARESQILDAAERQRASAQTFIQKQQAMSHKKSADPNKQRQAKMMKEKKLERIGNYREDGKRYKNFSLASMSEKSLRLAQTVQVEVDAPIISMRLPNPVWPPGLGEHDPLVCFERFSFGYDTKLLLNEVTVGINRRSKAALVGVNGAGKSTLMKLIAGDITPTENQCKGTHWLRPNIRVRHVTQYAVEELDQYKDLSVVDYAEEKLGSSKVAVDLMNKASGNIRQYLGAFGLGGRHAHQTIKQLSGGERMRLAFATALAGMCTISLYLVTFYMSSSHLIIFV